MTEFDTSHIASIAVALSVSLFMVAALLQKFFKNWGSSSTESSLLSMMHQELERMSKQNGILAVEIGKLQIEVITLNGQLTVLTIENQNLHAEVTRLTSEVVGLQAIIARGIA